MSCNSCSRASARSRACGGGQPQRAPADEQIVEDVHARKDARQLEHAHQPAPRQALRLQSGARLAVEPDRALIAREVAGHDVEQRRLARSIRADEADEFARRHIERDVGDGDEAAEAFAHALHGEKRAHATFRRRGASAVVTRPHRPVRKSRAKTMTKAAKMTSCQPPTSRSHSDVT